MSSQAQLTEFIDGETSEEEIRTCRADDCERTFTTDHGRNRHEGMKHNDVQSELLLTDLREFADELGRAPVRQEVKNNPEMQSHSAYESRFGSWNDALKEAGLEVNREQGTPTSGSNEDLLDELRVFANELGRTPKAKEVTKNPEMVSKSTYQYWFGSWNNAVKEAVLEVNEERASPIKQSDEELLEELRSFADELGRTPAYEETKRNPEMVSPTAYGDRFGSWNDALKEAGLEVNQEHKKWTGDILDELRSFADKLGRSPKGAEVSRNPEIPSTSTYYNRFESWNDVLKEAGLEVNEKYRGSIRNSGGKGDQPYDYGPWWNRQRDRAFERDDGVCQVCQAKQCSDGRTNHVHHIRPRWNFYFGSRCWFRVNDLNNLITLCASCHSRLEGKFQDTSPDEFAELGQKQLGYFVDADTAISG